MRLERIGACRAATGFLQAAMRTALESFQPDGLPMTSSPPQVADWSWLRQNMPVHRRWAYFDHAAVSPLPQLARQALQVWLDEATEQGDTAWPRWARQVEQVRQEAAQLLGVEQDEIALVRNTTEGINLVAEGFPWQQGDNVVFAAADFPSNRFPWMNLASRGVEPRPVPSQGGYLEPSTVAEACDDRTRIVAASWVDYLSGRRNDIAALAQIAHSHGGYLFLDAIQGLGVLPLDVRSVGVDFAAADGHKWLLGPEGAGLAWFRRDLLPMLRPLGIGWNSSARSGDFSTPGMQLKDTAARYEGGTFPTATFLGLSASMKMLRQLGGPQAIEPQLKSVVAATRARLRKLGAQLIGVPEGDAVESGIILFDLPGQPANQVRQRCLEAGVVLSARGGHLRLSPHAYCNEDDLDRLAAALQRT